MNATVAPAPRAPLGCREIALVLAASALATVWLVAWAWGTPPTIGDEGAHLRRAINLFEAGHRLTFDPLYPPDRVGYVGYWDPCLWHQGLAGLWRLTGGPAVASAQLYHALFFFLLAVFTYLTAREVQGRRGAAWAWALVLSVPTTVLGGMTFYTEVPMLALTAMAFYFLARRWSIPFGAALGLACLMKLGSALALAVPMLATAPLVLAYRWRERALGIAMALSANPKLLLLDEPLAGMNAAEVRESLTFINKIRSAGTTVLLVEHNMRAVMELCDRIVVINFGCKIAEGLPDEIKRNKDVIEAYLGAGEHVTC